MDDAAASLAGHRADTLAALPRVPTHADHIRDLPLREGQYTQLGHGEAGFRSAKASNRNTLVLRLRTQPKSSMTKVPAEGWMALVMPLAWRGEFRINGERAAPGRVHALGGRNGFTSLGQERDVVTFGLRVEPLRHAIAALAGLEADDVRIPEGALDKLGGGARDLARCALGVLQQRLRQDSGPGLADLHASEEADIYAVVAGALAPVATRRAPVIRRGPGALALVRYAEHAMRASAGNEIGLVDLCRAAGVSRTQLHAAFASVHGVSPVRYLRQWRLTIARERLMDPASISVKCVSLDLGFMHSGRFAAAYSATFGEPPLPTLPHAAGWGGAPREA